MTRWLVAWALGTMIAEAPLCLYGCGTEPPCPVPCAESCCAEGYRCEVGPPSVCVLRGLP